MLFNSYIFIFVFLPAVLLGLFLINQFYKKLAISWLILCSLFFYGWWNWKYLFLIIFSILLNYSLGILIAKTKIQLTRKVLLILGIGANLFILGYYKYTDFFIRSLDQLFGLNIPLQNIVLPLAVSFFTFQQISYLADIYRRETQKYTLQRYILFVVFFPHLIAGPILHHEEIIPQFLRKKSFKVYTRNLVIGFTLFTIGLFKKVVLADNMAPYAAPVFAEAKIGLLVDFYRSWEGVLAYSLQLYFDFSGYSDMAIGLARLFDVKLPVNFYSPYKAASIISFWQRWNITLSRFLKDYLYIPLGGNKKGPIRRHLNLFITMLLGGLWHGANWTFVIWGSLHGVYLIINHAFRSLLKSRNIDLSGNPFLKCVAVGLTFLCVLVGWVFFRSETGGSAILLLKGMAGLNGFHFTESLAGVWITALLLVIWLFPNTHEFLLAYEPALDKHLHKDDRKFFSLPVRWQPTKQWALILAIMLVISILYLSNPSEFLYFQF